MNNKNLAIILLILALLVVGFLIYSSQQTSTPTDSSSPPATQKFTDPLDRVSDRVTKKFFGTKVAPQSSPVTPERFTGYHTGVDFETFPDEQNTDVAIKAICDGSLKVKRTASGYGGVVVQDCVWRGHAITVIYGHLRIASVSGNVGDQIKAGDVLGVLGTGYSTETDGERKHLHLGIHNGTDINIAGYVQNQSSLSGWIDFLNP